MKRRLVKKSLMYKAVRGTLINADPATIAQMPQMDTAMVTLTENIDLIENFAQSQSENRKGIAKEKDDIRLLVENNTFILAGKNRSFAINNDNIILKQSLYFPISTLKRMADTNLIVAAKFVIEKAEENLVNLADYGVTATTITKNKDKLTEFENIIQDPRMGITDKKLATTDLNLIFKQTDTLIDETMDTLVIIVKDEDKPFYNAYQSNRIIIDPPTIPLALRCFITDQEGQPVEKAAIKIDEISKIFKTTAKGSFQVKSLLSATHTMTIKKAGSETKTITFSTTKGQRTDLHIILKTL